METLYTYLAIQTIILVIAAALIIYRAYDREITKGQTIILAVTTILIILYADLMAYMVLKN